MKVVAELVAGRQQLEPVVRATLLIAFKTLTAGTILKPDARSINELIEVLVGDAEIFRRVVAKPSTGDDPVDRGDRSR